MKRNVKTNESTVELKRLSGHTLSMKFMQRDKEALLREQQRQERETMIKNSHWIYNAEVANNVILQEESSFIKNQLGRKSFGSFNSEIEKLQKLELLRQRQESKNNIDEPEVKTEKPPKEPEPEPLGDDFDIFAGAGDYNGVDLGDDDDDEDEDDEAHSKLPVDHRQTSQNSPPGGNSSRKWILTEEDEMSSLKPRNSKTRSPSPTRDTQTSARKPEGHDIEMEEGQTREHEEQPARLQPLENSSLPSIRDFLAMDEAAEAAEKRRKRKEKKKAGGEGGSSKSLEQKVNRDFQRLQSYTSKKEASGSK